MVEAPAVLAAAITEGGGLYYLGLGILVIMMIWGAILARRSWEEATEDLEPATPDELLDAFKQARAEGEIDDEEYARVRRRIEQGE
jgi:uncharacterized membrane protein